MFAATYKQKSITQAVTIDIERDSFSPITKAITV
jgi:hypothetical protein